MTQHTPTRSLTLSRIVNSQIFTDLQNSGWNFNRTEVSFFAYHTVKCSHHTLCFFSFFFRIYAAKDHITFVGTRCYGRRWATVTIMTVKRQFGVILINHNSDINSVMDLERGIVAILHSFKECRTDIKVVWHHAPLKILIEQYCYSQLKDYGYHCFKGPYFRK